MMLYVLWAVLLMTQNAASTWVSRARNSSSYGYHAMACIPSNGVWFASQLVLVGSIVDVARRAAWLEAFWLGCFYTTFTAIGSVTMHVVSHKFLEKGKRKVGG